MRDLLGQGSTHFGSNSWVLSGEKTKTGKPLLANDPHLEFSQPARWYEMHLKGGKYNTSGVCIAGIPVPVIGNNKYCAWGFTNSMVDDVDFFIGMDSFGSSAPGKDLYKYFNITEEKIIQIAKSIISKKEL